MASWSSRAVASLLVLGAALAPLSARAADKSESQARQLAKEGQQHYDLGEFDKALEKFSEAYKLKNAPALLFNLAQCHRKLGNWEQSAFFFGRFIDNSNPTAPNIEVARELLEDARRKQGEAAEQAPKRRSAKTRSAPRRKKSAAAKKRPRRAAPPSARCWRARRRRPRRRWWKSR
jgi:tetratricopeptide (TPR) repeat protein